ncbi:hypothetical protein B0H67DRAFT_572649 [Lasiosphaeris hirsuta]|uniref:Uncharacterized protein n=1 Tax=Lasiosphaeris hirsuta TaxID=260670 RepID=A0AA40ANQ6_9PEZI|nr:hypothetical protein B0H67DRAFT_572649 [Lasiosphaeris hirsuta]
MTYFHDRDQWRVIAPLVVLLGLVSVAMIAMQVELGLDALGWQHIWPGFLGIFRWTPAVVVTLIAVSLALIVVFVEVLLVLDWRYAQTGFPVESLHGKIMK